MSHESDLNYRNIEISNYIFQSWKLKLQYKFDIYDEIEKNNLSFINKIYKPDMGEINECLQVLDSNGENIFLNITNKLIDEKVIFTRTIIVDENYFFRSINFFFTHSQNYYNYFRNIIYI